MTPRCAVFALMLNLALCYGYPLFGGKRYFRTVPIRRSYISIPMGHLMNEYQLPEYDDTYVPTTQDDYEYGAFDKYPFVQYVGYYPGRNYYQDKSPRRGLEGYEYYGDESGREELSDDVQASQDKSDVYPYGQETWYEEELPRYDRNADVNAAFLQNLIMAQMYQDARNRYPYRFESGSDADYDRNQKWFYGVPTTEVEDKEKVKQYFKNREDEEVRELESLARRKSKSKKLKDKDARSKHKHDGSDSTAAEKPTKSKSKMTDDEYFDMQKQIIVKNRKNGYVPTADSLRVNKKQNGDGTTDPTNDLWTLHQHRTSNQDSSAISTNINNSNNNNNNNNNSDKRLNMVGGGKDMKAFSGSKVSGSVSASTTKRPMALGQKEVVLPRPSNPVRRPFSGDLATRSARQPSVYDTIKRLLNMENELQRESMSPPQKRFVLNEDELTAELSGLKKKSA